MFKPKRLIYKQWITEGLPDAINGLTTYPFKVTEKASNKIQGVSRAVGESVEGVFKGGKEVGGHFFKNILWDDLGAGLRSLTVGWFRALKSMTWDTGKNLIQGEVGAATKSLFWDGAGNALVAQPLLAAGRQIKGLANLVPDVAYVPVSAVKGIGHVAGLGVDRGERNYGLWPAFVSAAKGLGGFFASPFTVGDKDSWFGKIKSKFVKGELRMDMALPGFAAA